MAITTADPSARNDIELASVTHWPTVYAAAGVGVFLIVGLAAVEVAAAAPAANSTLAVSPLKPLAPPPASISFPVVKPIIRRPDEVSVPIPIPSPVTDIRESELLFANDLQADVRQINLDAVEGTSLRLLVNADQRIDVRRSPADTELLKKTPPLPHGESVVNLIAHRKDLAGLPVRSESERHASRDAAKCLQKLSLAVQTLQACAARFARDGQRAASKGKVKARTRDQCLIELLAKRKEWLKDEYAPGLAQMLCVETTPVRLQLTKMLSAIQGPNASVALARQSLFDLSPQVRQAAIEALTTRPREEYRPTLVDGFRYPLLAVADRAASALTALKDRGAVPFLEKLLDKPDPAAPRLNEKKKWVVAEVVKVNHLRNCVLCHAPSSGEDNPLRGFVPQQGQPIPALYEVKSAFGNFVRADVTYLRQDYSLMESVPNPGKWPARQRFDYMIRERGLTDQEIIGMADGAAEPAKTYPQREAVRQAIKRLTEPDAHTLNPVGLRP